MSKTRDTGNITNVIKVDATGNVSFVSGSTTLATINTSGQMSGSLPALSSSYALSASYVTNAETLDGLDSTVFTLTSSFNTTSASLYTVSSSAYATSGSLSATSGSLSATSGSLNTRVTALEITGSALSSSILSVSASSYSTSGSLSATSGSLSAASGSFNTRVSALEVTGSSLSSSILSVSASSYSTSGSLSSASGSFNTRISTVESKYATTGSNTFIGTQTISGSILQSGSFTSTGTLTAQTLVVQTITSSVVYSSGSNIFGNSLGNSQVFTGSVLITGSLALAGNITSNGTAVVLGSGTSGYLPKFTGTSTIGNSNLINDASGNLGLGVTPSAWNSIFNVIQGPQGSVVAFQNNGPSLKIGSNFYYSSLGQYEYITTNPATRYEMDTTHRWSVAPLDTAGHAITFTQAMTLTAGGKLGVGTTSPQSTFVVGVTADTQGCEIDNATSGVPRIFAFNRSGGVSLPLALQSVGGNVLIGTTTDNSTGAKLQVTGAATFSSTLAVGTTISAQNGGTYAGSAEFAGILRIQGSGGRYFTSGNGLEFSYNSIYSYNRGTNAYNDLSINDSMVVKGGNGNVGIGTPAPTNKLHVKSDIANDWLAYFEQTNAAIPAYNILIQFTAGSLSTNSSSSYAIYSGDPGSQRFSVRGNGGIYNFQANDSNLSDIRTKKDIIPLESYWDKFKAIEIVKFKYIDQTHDDFNIGVIAQQVEEIAPEFVDTDYWENPLNEDKTEMKSVFTTDLYHATIKVLQEAMTKIEEQQIQIQNLQEQNQDLKSRLDKAGL